MNFGALSCINIVRFLIFISMLPGLAFTQELCSYLYSPITPLLHSGAVIYIRTTTTMLGLIAFCITKSAYWDPTTLFLWFSNWNSTAIHWCWYVYWWSPRSSRSATPLLHTNAVTCIGYTHYCNYSRRCCILLQQISLQLEDHSIVIIPELQLYCYSQMLYTLIKPMIARFLGLTIFSFNQWAHRLWVQSLQLLNL